VVAVSARKLLPWATGGCRRLFMHGPRPGGKNLSATASAEPQGRYVEPCALGPKRSRGVIGSRITATPKNHCGQAAPFVSGGGGSDVYNGEKPSGLKPGVLDTADKRLYLEAGTGREEALRLDQAETAYTQARFRLPCS
jgi:hypothetical protein